MFQRRDFSHLIHAGGGCSTVLAAWLLSGGVAAAQDSRSTASKPVSPIPAATPAPLNLVFTLPSGVEQPNAPPTLVSTGGAGRLVVPRHLADLPADVRRITLQQAQQMAAAATNPVVRLGQLQVEAAEQHRLGVKANYYPNVATQAYGLRLSTFPGDALTVQRPIRGGFISVPVNIIEQNQFAVNVAAVQPITPIFAVRQLVRIARADENIARAKAGMPVLEQASIVEKGYFDLLIAERELISAGTEARKVQAKWRAVSDSGTAQASTEQQSDAFGAAKAILVAASRVKELTASLNDLLGLPAETRLELVPPDPLVENLSLNEATANATNGSAEIIEAEQTAVKAHAGSKLAKMEYFPSIAVMGGYTHQNVLNAVLKDNFGYIGVVGTYTLFNGGKRERGVKEARAQAEAADLGVQLTKAKVAGAVKTGYLRLERSRQLYQLARRMLSAGRVVEASFQPDRQDLDPARAKLEAELFRADLEYRQAYAQVKNLIAGQATGSAPYGEGISAVRE